MPHYKIPLLKNEEQQDIVQFNSIQNDEEIGGKIENLLGKHKEVVTEKLGKTNILNYEIKLIDNVPVRSRFYPLSPPKAAEMEAHIKQLLDKGIIEKSSSPYASPAFLIDKASGGKRLCCDYRAYKYVPFGLCVSPQSLNRVVDMIFGDIKYKYIIPFVDDICVFSKDKESHVQHLDEVLSRLALGAVLQQEVDGALAPVCYASRTLSSAERRQTVYELECAAAVFGVTKFKQYLEVAPFELQTDNAALSWLFEHPKQIGKQMQWNA
ncbi:uncharacterized protein LOC134653711 [Cydia amplana]|uniref:uncharacterized protein LOC134653711 n=1 Tax=Cydia amplana TaxID=1869771 RepID=UPI002FE5220A